MSTTGSSINGDGPAEDGGAAAAAAAAADVMSDGEDEIAHLRHQVAELRATAPTPPREKKKKDKGKDKDQGDGAAGGKHHHKKKKKKAMFKYWQETSNAAPHPHPEEAAVPAPPVKKWTPPVAAAAAATEAGAPDYAHHHYTPSLSTPSMGRPSGQERVLFRPKADQYEGLDDKQRGEKWSPSTEIGPGSVSRFKHQFNHDEDDNGNDLGNSLDEHKGQSTWKPQEEIDAGRIDSIKNMWGKKTAGSHAPKLPPQPTSRSKMNVSRWDGGGAARRPSQENSTASGAAAAAVTATAAAAAVATVAAVPAVTAASSDDSIDASRSTAKAGEDASHAAAADVDAELAATEEPAGETVVDAAMPEKLASNDSSVAPAGNDEGGGGGIKSEIVLLVAEVLPDQLDNVDELLGQFEGREEKLRDTLKGMQVRVVDESGEEEGGDEDGGYKEQEAAREAAVHRHNDDGESITTVSSMRSGDGEKLVHAVDVSAVADAMVARGSVGSRGSGASQRSATGPAVAAATPAAAAPAPARPKKNLHGYWANRESHFESKEVEDEIVKAQRKKEAMLASWKKREEEATKVNRAGPGGGEDGGSVRSRGSASRGSYAQADSLSHASGKTMMPPPTLPRAPGDANDDHNVMSHSEMSHGALSHGTGQTVSHDHKSLGEGTIESEESRHVSFAHHSTGVRLSDAPEVDVDPTTDAFTGRSYYQSSGSPPPNPTKLGSNGSDGGFRGSLDVEGGMMPPVNEGAIPLVTSRDMNPKVKDTEKLESEGGYSKMSFETLSMGVPSQVGVLKNGNRAPSTVVSALPEPQTISPRRRRTPWYKRARTMWCACFCVILLALCGAALGLYFAGFFGGGGGNEPEEDESKETVFVLTTDDPSPTPSAAPTYAPSTTPSETPSARPVTECERIWSDEYGTFNLGNSPNANPPNVDMDGNHAVVVTNSGDVRFFRLNPFRNQWEEVDYFPNLNRSRFTPAVSLSGDVAVVGFLYHVFESGQGTGGAYVYERNVNTGRWRRADILTPAADGGIDTSANFGWSVGVDARQERPLIAVGAFGENDEQGSVYIFEKRTAGGTTSWSQAGKILPDLCPNGLFGYTVAVHGSLIGATTDCEFIVQLFEYDRSSGDLTNSQNIRYISYQLGAVAGLVMNGRNLAYSTVFGGVVIFEKRRASRGYEFQEQLDYSGNPQLSSYPLALDDDILVVGVGNNYRVLPKKGDSWDDGSFFIENEEANVDGVPSVAVSGRTVLAGSGSPHEVFHYDIQVCTDPRPTQSPTFSSRPTISTAPTIARVTNKPTERPTTPSPSSNSTMDYVNPGTNESLADLSSSKPSFSPTNRPTIDFLSPETNESLTDLPSRKPSFVATNRPTPRPTSQQTPAPSAPLTEQKNSLETNESLTDLPSLKPSFGPTNRPTPHPTSQQTPAPSSPLTEQINTPSPSFSPTGKPTPLPSAPPVKQAAASTSPTLHPVSEEPTPSPLEDTMFSSQTPTIRPSEKPTPSPLEGTITPPTSASTPSPTSLPKPSCHPIEISIQFDSSPFGKGYVFSEVTATGETSLATFFPFDNLLANQQHTESFCLEEGSYKFVMYDSYGDGLCCVNGEGGYLITSDGVTLVQGAEFGYSEEKLFNLPAQA